MPSIAAVLIVKNEEQNLAACLESIKWVDQIVIVDSGSVDKTEDIAAQYNAEFYRHHDWQGFGIQRQRAESYVRADWILAIDADERVTPDLENSIRNAIKEKKCIGSIARLSWCFGRFIRHSGWYPDRVLRLYPTNLAGYNDALVHEKLENPNSLPIRELKGDLLHFTYDSMRHYLTKSAQYAEAWAVGRVKKGKTTTLSNGILHAVGCFLRMYVIKRGFMDGKAGFLLALLSAHSTFVKYADLWLRTKTIKNHEQP